MSKLIDELLYFGFITGSQAFGTARPDSDIDIVYSVQDSVNIQGIIKDREKESSNYFAGYTILDDDGRPINLIPVHPHEFLPWYLATKAMKETLKDSGIDNPIKKYAIFQGIMCLFKGTVKELVSIEAYNRLKKEILRKEIGARSVTPQSSM